MATPQQVEGPTNSGSGEEQVTPDEYPYLTDFSDQPPDASPTGQSTESSAKPSATDVPPAIINAAKPQAAVQEKPERQGEVVPDDTADDQRQSLESAAWAAINKQLGVDQGNQAAAAGEEKNARSAFGAGVGDALAAEGQQAQGNAIAGEAQASVEHKQVQDNISEIKQLVNDYAQGHIDPDQWWSEKSVPQQIGAVIGAVAAGLGGGVEGAMKYVNTMVDRNIAIQQDEIHRKGAAGYAAMNLLASNMHNSQNFQEALDKTRSEMMMAAALQVQEATERLRPSIDNAKIDELTAAAQNMQDMALAIHTQQAMAARHGSGLAVDPKTVVTDPGTRQTYKIMDPADQPALTVNMENFNKILDGLDEGERLLDERKGVLQNPSAYLPYSQNIQQGESTYGLILDAVGKMAAARGLPNNIKEVVSKIVPDFGSRAAGLEYGKIDQARKVVRQYVKDMLVTNGAVPITVTYGPGSGKHAGEWTPYATMTQGQPPASTGQPKPPPPKLDLQPAP